MNGSPSSPPATRRTPADPILRERDAKLESLKAVVGRLAHDFNNFLAPQYGYLTMLKDETPSESTVAVYLAAMGTAAQKAESYVSNILLGMRPYRQFSPREFAFHTVFAELLNKWVTDLPTGKEVQVSANLQDFLYSGDEKQWRTVFEHLLSNARYALAMGGKLEVSLSREKISGHEVQRLGLSTDDLVRFQIRDTGFGMSPEVLLRAFEPFFTTRTQIKAAGLGLTIVHGITHFHGGQIELESVEDMGTAVTIWLPLQPVRPVYNSYLGSQSGANRKRRVLLIEDDPLIKEVLRGWLGRHDLDVDSAANEEEARKVLHRAGADCVLVFCETDLQSGRGENLYASLSSQFPNPKWVFLSGSRTPDFTQAPSAEHPLVIKKPFSHNAFSDLVRKYLSR